MTLEQFERWAVVERYEVSDQGNVRCNGRPIRAWVGTSGHLYVGGGGNPKRAVHTLVLAAFVGPRPTGLECRHLDGEPTNNHLSNLVWGTRSQNIDDYRRHHGRHMQSHLSDAQRIEILSRLTGAHGELSRLAEEYGVSKSVVQKLSLRSGRRHNRQLTRADVVQVRALFESGVSPKVISEQFDVSQYAVSKIVRGITWA